MKRIIYCSQATVDFSGDDLVDLLAGARERNSAAGVTGMLIACSQSFLQLLEGDADALDDIYRSITADARHARLRLLMDEPCDTRLFGDWSMGFEHLDADELADQVEGFVADTRYPLVNPDLVTNGEVAQRLLLLYSDNRAVEA